MASAAEVTKEVPGSREPCVHTVQFYSDGAFLVDSVSQFIGSALLAGASGIVIATEEHRDGIAKRLKERGMDLTVALSQGRYITLDPRATLATFLVDNWPDEARFADLMGGMIASAKAGVGKDCREPAIFGEMVSLLWAEGKYDAALRLEQLWNNLARTHAFSLRCAYPLTGFDRYEHGDPMIKICAEHGAVIPEESYGALTTDGQRSRTIAVLQQRAQALESEIAERRKTERLLQRGQAELLEFLDSAVVAMSWVAADGTISWANRTQLEQLGYGRDEYVGHRVGEFYVDPSVSEDIQQRLARHEELRGYEARLRCRDGTVRVGLIHSSVFVQDGQFVYHRCFTVDVTEQQRADEARLRLAAIVESSEDAIVSKNLDGIVTSWNSAAQRMFGYAPEEIIGRPITTIIPPELQDEERTILATLRRGERIEHFETVRITKTGERLDVSLTVSPVRADNGQIIGAAKIGRDIRQRKKMEEALRTSEKLIAVGRMAAAVAHEVNNPLEALTNLIFLAKNHDTATDAVRRYLSDAEEELSRAAEITRQTLGFYHEHTSVTRMQVGGHLRQLVLASSSKMKNKGSDIRLEIEQDPEIVAKPGEIRQLLANILNNAIDAVNSGGNILIRVSAGRGGSLRMAGVRISIVDSGPGITVPDHSRIFEPFYTTRPEVRTGLGLWICKSIVERHAGTIRIRSNPTPGRSWTFVSIFLPTAAVKDDIARLTGSLSA